jgi:hypothetical protein
MLEPWMRHFVCCYANLQTCLVLKSSVHMAYSIPPSPPWITEYCLYG